MSGSIDTLIGLFAFWMAACCYCGLYGRFVGFLAVLFAGLMANMFWMVFGLKADAFGLMAINVQGAGILCALCAYLLGCFAGRIRRAWNESAITDPEV